MTAMTDTIGTMTHEELETLIDRLIERRLKLLFGDFEVGENVLFDDDDDDQRTWDEVRQDIERDRWTPPPGAKSSLELLREDRDR
jgi:hypothetical protein